MDKNKQQPRNPQQNPGFGNPSNPSNPQQNPRNPQNPSKQQPQKDPSSKW